jgi:hypothetical protein
MCSSRATCLPTDSCYIIVSLECNLFSPWYSWKNSSFDLALNNNHSLLSLVVSLIPLAVMTFLSPISPYHINLSYLIDLSLRKSCCSYMCCDEYKLLGEHFCLLWPVFRQIVPMSTNCAPFKADMFYTAMNLSLR